MNKNLKKITLSLATASIIGIGFTGCSGGASSPSSSNDTNTISGQFIDAPVEGLNYECSSGKTGITDQNGGYSCNKDDDIVFKLGDLVLGSAPIGSIITPFHLYPDNEGKEKAYNVSQILHSFDNDNDPDNNIKIDTDLLDGMTLSDINISTSDSNTFENTLNSKLASSGKTPFNRNQAKAKMVSYINENGGKNKYNVDINISSELQSLQDEMCNNAEVLRGGECAKETYLNIEVSNNINEGTTVVTYDNKGNPLVYLGDSDNDGIVDRKYLYTYDKNGNVLSSGDDNDLDGIINNITTFTYDSNGNKLTETSSSTALDGTVTTNHSYTWTYDSNGNKLTYKTQYGTYHYRYDDNGNMLSVSEDSGDDGTINWKEAFTYDHNGNMLTKSIDNSADNVIDRVYLHTYDDNGNLLTKGEDSDADGIVDKNQYRYTYDDNGNLLTGGRDSDLDGVLDQFLAERTYDSNGNLLTIISNTYGNGESVTTSFTYDNYGNQLTATTDRDGDGVADSSYTNTWVSLTDYLNGNYSVTNLTLPSLEIEEDTPEQVSIPSGINLIKIVYNGSLSYEQTVMNALVNMGAPYTNVSTAASSDISCTSYGFSEDDITEETEYYDESEKYYSKDGKVCRETTYNSNADDAYGSDTVLITLTNNG